MKFTPLIHFPGLIVHNSTVYVILKKKKNLVFIIFLKNVLTSDPFGWHYQSFSNHPLQPPGSILVSKPTFHDSINCRQFRSIFFLVEYPVPLRNISDYESKMSLPGSFISSKHFPAVSGKIHNICSLSTEASNWTATV